MLLWLGTGVVATSESRFLSFLGSGGGGSFWREGWLGRLGLGAGVVGWGCGLGLARLRSRGSFLLLEEVVAGLAGGGVVVCLPIDVLLDLWDGGGWGIFG